MRNGSSILVIVEDLQLRDCLCEALNFEGYKTECARDWNTYLKSGPNVEKPSLIFWDARMSLETAIVFVELLRQDEYYSGIPIAIISSEASQTEIRKFGNGLSVLPRFFDLDVILSVAAGFCKVPAL